MLYRQYDVSLARQYIHGLWVPDSLAGQSNPSDKTAVLRVRVALRALGLFVDDLLTADELGQRKARLPELKRLHAEGQHVAWRRAEVVKKVAGKWVRVELAVLQDKGRWLLGQGPVAGPVAGPPSSSAA